MPNKPKDDILKNKKWMHDNNTPEENRTTADPAAKILAADAVTKFETEKAKGKTLKDVQEGTILVKEVQDINKYNSEPIARQHVDLYGNYQNQAIMGQFIYSDGTVANEVVSSRTPEGEKNNRTEYNEEFTHLGVTKAQSEVGSSESSSEEDSSSDSPSDIPVTNTATTSLIVPSPNTTNTASGEKDSLNVESVKLLKRKHDDSSEDSEQGPSKRPIPQNVDEDTISSIYELGGDD